MKPRRISGTLPLLVLAVGLTVISWATVAQAQNSADKTAVDPLSGKFEGVVKSTPGVDTRLALEITNEKGRLSGRFITPQGATAISGGSFSKGKLTLKLGSGKTATKIKARLQNDTLSGEWIDGKNRRAIELQRVRVVVAEVSTLTTAPASPPEPAPAVAPPTPTVSDASVSVAGDWDAIADAQGQGLPFTLSLRVDGEKVTGESNSSLGSGTISNGTWKDGKLVFQLDTSSGTVAMSAVVKDGGLVGEFDFGGQIQGRWVAKKRTP